MRPTYGLLSEILEGTSVGPWPTWMLSVESGVRWLPLAWLATSPGAVNCCRPGT